MPRAIWTGSISFGLVNIPIKLFSAIREHDVHFHQLAPDGSRVHYKRVSEKSGREVDYSKIRRGFEVSRGKYVAFEPEELKALAPTSSKTIDIEDFVALEDIDPIYFERTYHLAPANDAAGRAYALLAAVMEDRGRVGIGRLVLRERQHLAAVRPFGKALALSTMLFADEVVDASDIPGVPSRRATVPPREKKLAAQIVDSLESEWKPERYRDDYEDRLKEIIKAKSKGKVIEAEEPEQTGKVLDLMEALRASLDDGKRTRRPAAKKTGRSAAKKKARPAKKTAKRSARRSA